MTVFMTALGICSFLFGFYLGIRGQKTPCERKIERIKIKAEEDRELMNFLSYDGSEQL